MARSIFKTVYFLVLVLISAARLLTTSKIRNQPIPEDHSTNIEKTLHFLSGVGILIPLVYIFSSWFDFANYHLPDILGWIGSILFVFAAGILWMSYQALDKNWTPTLGFRAGHILVTTGIYKFIRHPTYAAHLIWAIAQPLILHNWIAGFSFLVVALPQYLMRVNDEEKMMVEKFGREYEEYQEKTGRLFPKFF